MKKEEILWITSGTVLTDLKKKRLNTNGSVKQILR